MCTEGVHYKEYQYSSFWCMYIVIGYNNLNVPLVLLNTHILIIVQSRRENIDFALSKLQIIYKDNDKYELLNLLNKTTK